MQAAHASNGPFLGGVFRGAPWVSAQTPPSALWPTPPPTPSARPGAPQGPGRTALFPPGDGAGAVSSEAVPLGPPPLPKPAAPRPPPPAPPRPSSAAEVRAHLADILGRIPNALEVLDQELSGAAGAAPALAFLAVVIKDYGVMEESIELYRSARCRVPLVRRRRAPRRTAVAHPRGLGTPNHRFGAMAAAASDVLEGPYTAGGGGG